MNKYVILDFGKVLGHQCNDKEIWFITPNFYDILDIDEIDREEFKKLIPKYGNYIGNKMNNTMEEYIYFKEFYSHILNEMGYGNEKQYRALAEDWTFNVDKFKIYDDVYNELEYLSSMYKLILLSDNWPSLYKVMSSKKLDQYFTRMYSSSDYGERKKYGRLFDYPIKEFDLKGTNTRFVDDEVINLDMARRKGLVPIEMSREEEFSDSSYPKIKTLFDLK